ncbi:MAG: SpoIIE family protein phosphatase [Candidatus Eisenbacteria bacterium]
MSDVDMETGPKIDGSAGFLEITNARGEVSTYSLSEERPCALGRSSKSDVVLGENPVSRNHARIEFREGRYRVEDLGSTNGTKFRGAAIEGSEPLEPGDLIEIGPFRIRFLTGSESAGARLIDSARSMTLDSIAVDDIGRIGANRAAPAERREENDLIRKADRVGQALLAHHSLEDLYQRVVDLVGEVLGPDRCALLLCERGEENLDTRAVYRASGSEDPEILISRSIAKQTIRERKAILIEDAQTDERFRDQQSVIMRHIHTAMCAPLWDDDRVIGLLYADDPTARKPFRRDDLHLFSLIGHLAAVKIRETVAQEELNRRRQIEEELKRAAEIQGQFLPDCVLRVGDIAIAGRNVPCLGVGGDYFDYLETIEGEIVFALGDVSGKGMSAALLMATLHANVRAFLETRLDLGDVVLRLNRFIHQSTRGERFATLFLAKIDRETGVIRYVNAGHNYPLLLRPDGAVTPLSEGGLMVGAFPGIEYGVAEAVMERGSTLLVYSDGVCEAFNDKEEEFGDERVVEYLKAHAGREPEELVEALMDAVMDFVKPEAAGDDVTVVAVRRSGP